MKNKFVNIFIVAFFTGATLNILFSVIDNTILRNEDFQISDWEFSNYIVLFTSIILVYVWIKRNRDQ
jgi:protein-S-isoprenylcysteine O-methyltransferase Ste14